jgi:DUF1680 family protein
MSTNQPLLKQPFSEGRRRALKRSGALCLWPAVAGAAAGGAGGDAAGAGEGAPAVRVRALPLAQVRLTPSPWLSAVNANLKFLLSLEPDRLLARFRENAGLAPRAEVYGGWESDTIAGHTLGHYLSALSLMHAQTGDAECKRRADYIVAELASCQAQSADGYVAALGRRLDERVLADGKSLFDDVMAGKIDPRFGNLNGGWAPLYNIHKQLAGLLEAHALLGNGQALQVALGMAGYIERVFSRLDEAQTQLVLDCEYGGLQEAIAELYARSGERRWLALARRLRHDKTFRPVAEGRDELDKLHSNTEIPKYVASARLYEVGGGEDNAAATRFFWRTVTAGRSYVNGGNGDREWFYPKGRLSHYITDQTCEHCSTYNMLKMTRHLFQWEPQASWFDFYERAHINHTLAAQHPGSGMFAYMAPMMAGAKRVWSEPQNQFWCCMGSGMEAHAKHGDSIYWESSDGKTLYVNEYIPSVADWPGAGRFELKTRFPHGESIAIEAASAMPPVTLKLRIPGWCGRPALKLNGQQLPLALEAGYASVTRAFQPGDRVELSLPMAVRQEAAPDNPQVRAFFHGPLLLAADLGSGGEPLLPDQAPPVVGAAGAGPELLRARGDGGFVLSRTAGAALTLRPYYSLWDRRTAVYFPFFTPAAWPAEARRRARLAAERAALAAGTLDQLLPGDEASEAAHRYADARTEPTPYRGRKGRLIKSGGGFIEADLRSSARPLALYVTYWGEAERGMLDISVDGELLATQRLNREKEGDFFEARYAIPQALTSGKASIRVRLAPRPGTRGPSVYGVRVA